MRTARWSLLILALGAALAQDPRGSIVGQVTDSTGAVAPGVAVRFTHGSTNVVTTATSNNQGNYEAPYLPAGEYQITAELQGFKSWRRPPVELRIGDRVRIDIQLEVGSLAETVEVTAQAPVLESTSGSIGQVIDSRQFADMPLRSGSIAWLYAMAPATVLTALPYDGPWNITQSSNVAIAGGSERGGVDFNVDGVSNNSTSGQTAFVPPPDMVDEVRIDITTYDAAVGHTLGSSINVSLKSGNNALHGTLGTSVSSGPMMTRNFFTNRFIYDPTTGPITPEKIKANTPSVRWLRHGGAVGGPLYLPRLYDGRNQTFWMFGYQSHNRRRPVATVHTVPALAQRQGDFSELLALGSQYQIYDPFTTAAAGARFQRQPLAGNRLPASRMDRNALGLLKYFPAPNAAGTRDGLNNYSRTRQDTQDLYQPVARLDHVFSEKRRMFARYSHSTFHGHFDNLVEGSNARGRRRQRPHRGLALDHVAVLSPQTVLDVRYGLTWFREFESFDNIGWDLREFGFPAGLVSQLDPAGVSFPQLNVAGLLQLGNDGGFKRTYYSHSLLGVLNWNKASHSLKFGFDGRLLLENAKEYGNVSPRLDFGETYTRGPLDNSPVAPAGQGSASFLFGIPTAGWVDLNDSRAESTRFYGMFLQDDWRIRRNFTMNLGLRWEYEGPVTERFNRSSRDFDFATTNPIQARAAAGYTREPIPEVPVSQFRTLGGLTFLGTGGNPRGSRDPYWRAFMPRFGFSWQVRPRAVVRGGYGLFFGLIGVEFTDGPQPGFSQRTNVVASLDSGLSYVASIANPLPAGLELAPGALGGLTTFLGRAPGFTSRDGRRPYTQRWSYSVQLEPMTRTLVEISYIGSKTSGLRVSTQFNPVPRQYLSTLPVRDQAAIDFLSARAGNPFRGIEGFAGTAFFAGANTSRSQLLRPYPHFAGLATGLPAGSSWYHALTARFERRFQKGFQVQANYTWSKTMEASAYRNETDSLPEHLVAGIDRPHRFTFSALYELPFRSQGPLHHLVGGWQLHAIYQGQSGPPLAFGNVIYTGAYQALRLPGEERTLERWFNTTGFERNAQRQLASNIRTFPTRIAAARGDGINVWDLSAHKNFRITEKVRVQLRGEAEGAMNTPNFSPPNTTPASTLFGRVETTQTAQEERRIFVGLKVIF